MKSLDTLFPLIQPELPSCPNTLMRSALLRATIAFCKESEAWLVINDAIPVVNNRHTFEIDIPNQYSRLLMIKNIWAEGRELSPKTMNEIGILIPDWRSSKGSPCYYNQPTPTEVRVFPIPTDQLKASVVIRAAYVPLLGSLTIDDTLAELHYEPICMKAKAILMVMINQPWSNPAQSPVYAKDFKTECETSRIEAMHDRTQGSLTVTPRAFGR